MTNYEVLISGLPEAYKNQVSLESMTVKSMYSCKLAAQDLFLETDYTCMATDGKAKHCDKCSRMWLMAEADAWLKALYPISPDYLLERLTKMFITERFEIPEDPICEFLWKDIGKEEPG
jgi:hypothetical protein